MRHSRSKWLLRKALKYFILLIFLILLVIALISYVNNFFPLYAQYSKNITKLQNSQLKTSLSNIPFIIPFSLCPSRIISPSLKSPSKSEENFHKISRSDESHINFEKCTFSTCFNIHRCGRSSVGNKLGIYIYPFEKIIVRGKLLQKEISKEFYEIVDTILNSEYYERDPELACLFMPSVDLLNFNQFEKDNKVGLVKEALQSLDYWKTNNGANHIIFTMSPGKGNKISEATEGAMLISSQLKLQTFRIGFDLSFISLNPYTNISSFSVQSSHSSKDIKKFTSFLSIFIGSSSSRETLFEDVSENDVVTLSPCLKKSNSTLLCRGDQTYSYPQVLNLSEFCVIFGENSGTLLWDSMSHGCIPVIITQSFILPFNDIIDWKRNGILLNKYQIPEIGTILRKISESRKNTIKSQLNFTFNTYFKNMTVLTQTVLELLNERVFPHLAKSKLEWNSNADSNFETKVSPLFNNAFSPKSSGFTGVILAYERIASLFSVIERIAKVPSLVRILVIWNNVNVKPPPFNIWPKLSKELKIIQMSENRMTNRFYPFPEIETEAVFSVDDDIVMLTTDEIEFGFQVWREFPDRIVGFPSRTHFWDNSTLRWKYESEWKNEVTMVLTGAAFYHKYWHYAFFHEMKEEIRELVDKNMNCEDIAMNFLVSNRTGKPPIKVTPRKKFKCPNCSKNEMLSADSSHMVERSECLNAYSSIYGYMPLQPAEFRADPVLFKVDKLPAKLKKFRDIGTL